MTPVSRRPRSLYEVSLRARDGVQTFDAGLREFLDVFYANSDLRSEALRICPVPLDDVRDAYIAATAEHLAMCHGLPLPDWCEAYGRKLIRPFFAGGLEALKALLTVESPTAFRKRMLFVSKDALFRPRAATGAD